VGGVADAEESGAGPLGQAVDGYGEQADVFPVAEFIDAIAQERDQAGDLFAEGGEAAVADFVGGALGDHEGTLPIVFAIEQDHQSAAIDVAEGLAGVIGAAA